MKKRWIIFGVSGLMLIMVVVGVLFLLHFAMSSTSGRRKEFSTSRRFSDSSAGGGGESFGDSGSDGKLEEQPQQDNGWDDSYNYMHHHGQHNGYHGGDNGGYNGFDCYGNHCSLDASDDETALGTRVAGLASFFQGIRYEYGGETLPIEGQLKEGMESRNSPVAFTVNNDDCGVDCSGFVRAVYKYYNVNLPRTCKQQAKEGKEVRIKDIEAGDIVFYGADKDNITHCGIYFQEGKVIHSSAEAKKVIISDMNYRRIITVRRVV